uniref:F-box domain-containing protein n=1 Tax=Kalanchoe fedtschenkoi TaxID=63787 RepID=A0A7N0U9J8_KALFE
MKLRVRSATSKETLKFEVPADCTLSHLKQVIAERIGGASAEMTVSLNRKDELCGFPEDALRSLGVSSGDLVYYSLDSSVFVPKALTLGAESSASGSVAASSDTGVIDCGHSEAGDKDPDAVELSKASIGESKVEQAHVGDAKMADLTPEETLDFQAPGIQSDENMDVDPELVAPLKQRFTPYFLKNVWCNGEGSALSGHSLLLAAVHAVLVDSGFVRLDPATGEPVYEFQVPGDGKPAGMALSLRYTLDKLIELKIKSAAPETVVLKLHKLGGHLMVHGALVGIKNACYTLKLDEQHYGTKIETVLRKRGERVEGGGGGGGMLLNVLHEGEVFNFYKEVKDKLALPLLIDLCEKAGLPQPPCLMLLPTDLKLKIFELVSGADLAKLACQCSELQYVTSNNSLWRIKYMLEFGNTGEENDSTNWKQRYIQSWKIEKERKRSSEWLDRLGRQERMRWPRSNRWPPYPSPHIIGGNHDIFPFGGPGPFGGLSNRSAPLPHLSFQQVPQRRL